MTNDRSNAKVTPKIGEVYAMRFDGVDSEQQGWRPGIVFQNNIGNLHSPNIIALPMTTAIKKLYMPTHVLVKAASTGLRHDSMVICENPKCISKASIGRYITTLPDEVMREVAMGFLAATAATSFLDLPSLISVWQQSIATNDVA